MEGVSKAEAHLAALSCAQRIAPFNPRPRTLSFLTGLPLKEVARLFPQKRLRTGRAPSTQEWYHTGNLVERVEASVVAALYRRNRDNHFGVVESFIDAYERFHRQIPDGSTVSFERAFNLVGHLEPGSVFGVDEQSFDVAICPSCASQYLVALGDPLRAKSCIFCRLVERYTWDQRLQSHFKASPLPRAIPRF